jgi:hypothetical protein
MKRYRIFVEVRDLPQFTRAIKGEENLAAFKTWVNQFEFQRPLVLPPDTPKDRVQILRKAFAETLEDPEFLAEAEKSRLLVDYVSGQEIEGYVDQILSISPSIKKKLQFLALSKKA